MSEDTASHPGGRAGPGARGPDGREPSRRRRLIERATLYGLAGSAVIHLLVVLIAGLITVRFNFGDAGGADGTGVEFAVMDSAELAADASPVLLDERTPVESTLAESRVEMDLLTDTGDDRSIQDLSESIAPSLDPGGAGLTSIDATTGSSGAGSGDGASFFGLEAKGKRFAYIVDISGSMRTTSGGEQSRWDLTRRELARSILALESDTEFHVQLYSSGSISLFGGDIWSPSTQVNKRLTSDALFAVFPDGATNPEPAFRAVFSLDPEPDAIYYMTDGEVTDPGEFAAVVRKLNGRERIPVNCVLFGNAGSADAQQRVESLMRNIARQSGGRYRHVREGSP
ncbi:MAG: hypothetical protein AAGA55_10565 [Planctomycetota bacterium]